MKKLSFTIAMFSLLLSTVSIQGCNKPGDNMKELSEEYLIAFLRKGNLWVRSENGTGEKQLTNSGKVIALTCKESKIYFGELGGLNLKIKYVDINNLESIETVTVVKGSRENFFVEEMSEYPRGEMGWVSDNILGVSGNYECCDAAGFRDALSINLITKQVNHTNLFEGGFENHIKISTSNSVESKTADKNTSQFLTRKTGKEYEFFYLNNKNQEIKLSNTQQYTPRECWGEDVTSFSYILLPSDKIVYWFITDCGDLAHGVLHISNLDGTNQVLITDSFISGYENSNVLQSNGEFVFRLYDSDSQKYDLVSFTGESNERKIITEDITYFELVR